MIPHSTPALTSPSHPMPSILTEPPLEMSDLERQLMAPLLAYARKHGATLSPKLHQVADEAKND